MWAAIRSDVAYDSYEALAMAALHLSAHLTWEHIASIVLEVSDEEAIVPIGNSRPNQPKVWTNFSSEKVPKFGNTTLLPSLNCPLLLEHILTVMLVEILSFL